MLMFFSRNDLISFDTRTANYSRIKEFQYNNKQKMAVRKNTKNGRTYIHTYITRSVDMYNNLGNLPTTNHLPDHIFLMSSSFCAWWIPFYFSFVTPFIHQTNLFIVFYLFFLQILKHYTAQKNQERISRLQKGSSK